MSEPFHPNSGMVPSNIPLAVKTKYGKIERSRNTQRERQTNTGVPVAGV